MDTLEIIRQLQADSALRAQLRAVLLSEELLELPNVVANLAETLTQHSQRLEHLETSVDALVGHPGRNAERYHCDAVGGGWVSSWR